MKVFHPLTFKHFKYDFPAGIVVFLVAIPLCVGIAVACNVSPMAGLMAGIIGGIIVPFFSKAPYGVSGPAAGLIGIVLMALELLGTFEALLVATFIGGILQITLGFLQAGTLAYFIPSSVIKGMLAFIGISLIIKQLPHALGYDIEKLEWQFEVEGHKNIFYVIWESFEHIEPGALLISIIGFISFYLWQSKLQARFPFFPAALLVVILGIIINEIIYKFFVPQWFLTSTHLVNIPKSEGLGTFFTFPDWKALLNGNAWFMGIVIGIIASLESLLTLEAMDKLDPQKRITPLNIELIGQGVGNALSGLLGALPITVVIVRSTTSLSAGAKTKLATFLHGVLLALFVFIFPKLLNTIPLASLAVILIAVGIKLAQPKIFKTEFRLGIYRFVPFTITIIASLFTDLLTGILIGLAAGALFILYEHYRAAVKIERVQEDTMRIFLTGNISFLIKPNLVKTFRTQIPEDVQTVIIEAKDLTFIDQDILEAIHDFKLAFENVGKSVQIHGIDLSAFHHANSH